MPITQAHDRLARLDGDSPYESFLDYVAALAALTMLYKKEVMVKTKEKKKPLLRTALWSATAPMKMGYYFNNLVRVARLPMEQRAQLASGTTPNEVLKKKISSRFKHVPSMYQATLYITCEAFQFLRLLSHNCAEYPPADFQASQQQYVNRNMSSFALTEEEWLTVLSSSTSLFNERCEQAAKIRVIYKRPVRPRHIKRHTFNKTRLPAE